MSFHEAVGGWVSLMFWWNCTMKIHRTRKGPICQKWRNWCWVMYLMNDPASIDTHYDTWDELTFTTYLSTNICRAWNKHKTRMCRTNRPFCLFFSLHIINGAPANPFLYPGSTQKHHESQFSHHAFLGRFFDSSLCGFVSESKIEAEKVLTSAKIDVWSDFKKQYTFLYRQLDFPSEPGAANDFPSEPGVANEILKNEAKSCLAVL